MIIDNICQDYIDLKQTKTKEQNRPGCLNCVVLQKFDFYFWSSFVLSQYYIDINYELSYQDN
jgi:hypothetical protein